MSEPTDDPRCLICGGELFLSWEFSIPVEGRKVAAGDVAAHATTSSWSVGCEAGHVVAVSHNTATLEDCAETFDPDALLGEQP